MIGQAGRSSGRFPGGWLREAALTGTFLGYAACARAIYTGGPLPPGFLLAVFLAGLLLFAPMIVWNLAFARLRRADIDQVAHRPDLLARLVRDARALIGGQDLESRTQLGLAAMALAGGGLILPVLLAASRIYAIRRAPEIAAAADARLPRTPRPPG